MPEQIVINRGVMINHVKDIMRDSRQYDVFLHLLEHDLFIFVDYEKSFCKMAFVPRCDCEICAKAKKIIMEYTRGNCDKATVLKTIISIEEKHKQDTRDFFI